MTTELILYPLASGRYRVEHGGTILLAASDDPEFDACRALKARGITGKVRARHAGASHAAMQLDIERGAGLRTEETARVGPRVTKWRPFTGMALEGLHVPSGTAVCPPEGVALPAPSAGRRAA